MRTLLFEEMYVHMKDVICIFLKTSLIGTIYKGYEQEMYLLSSKKTITCNSLLNNLK